MVPLKSDNSKRCSVYIESKQKSDQSGNLLKNVYFRICDKELEKLSLKEWLCALHTI